MKRQQCSNCMFSSWYHNFKNITFKSKIIKLDADFIHYLNSDGIILPDVEETKYSNELETYSDEEDHWGNEDKDNQDTNIPSFPDIKHEVENAIKELGGVVFTKLNWSCPKDAAWISHNATLKCSTFNDICLLLKSSDFIAHDLTKSYEYCVDSTEPHPTEQFELILREWRDIMPGMEFRCFVKQNKLIGISQRHHSSFFEYLVTNKDTYLREIVNFYNCKIKNKFADLDYVFDIYKGKDIYFLVDFNPFGMKTDSLLFSWQELQNHDDPSSIDEMDAEFFRVVTSSGGIQPSPYVSYAMPKDVVDLSCGEDINKMFDFFRLEDLIAKPDEDECNKAS